MNLFRFNLYYPKIICFSLYLTLIFLQFNCGSSFHPLLIRIIVFIFFITIINLINFINRSALLIRVFIIRAFIFFWFKDILREVNFQGAINNFIQTCIKLGFSIFIFTEAIFFFSFFWAYFHFMLIDFWPPFFLLKINYIRIPLLNSLLLLSRGISLTLSHNYLLLNNFNIIKIWLSLTLILGCFFTLFQFWEFISLNYMWSDSSYASIFYMGTGFHGFHVLAGSIFLLLNLMYNYKSKINMNNIVFEIRAWYWHFVDIIWLILFTEFYWWINNL